MVRGAGRRTAMVAVVALSAGVVLGALARVGRGEAEQSGASRGSSVDPASLSVADGEADGDGDRVTTVLLVGDSLMHQTAPVVDELLDDDSYEVIARSTPGEGILTSGHDWMLDWVAELQRLVDQHAPDVVVVEFVGNYPETNALDDAGAVIEPRTEAFYRAWLERSVQLASVAVAAGAELHWVLPPAMDSPVDPGLGAHTDRMAALYRDELAAAVPQIHLLDWAGVFGAVDGGYRATMTTEAGTIVAREADGVHFTDEGTVVAAETLVTAVSGPVVDVEGRAA